MSESTTAAPADEPEKKPRELPPCLGCGKESSFFMESHGPEMFAEMKLEVPEGFRQVRITDCDDCMTWLKTGADAPRRVRPLTMNVLTPWESFHLGMVVHDIEGSRRRRLLAKTSKAMSGDIAKFFETKLRELGLDAEVQLVRADLVGQPAKS